MKINSLIFLTVLIFLRKKLLRVAKEGETNCI